MEQVLRKSHKLRADEKTILAFQILLIFLQRLQLQPKLTVLLASIATSPFLSEESE